MVAQHLASRFKKIKEFYKNRKTMILVSGLLIIGLFAYLKPQKFANLWLTPDQQGRLLFQLGHYQQAADHFESTRWLAYSLYGSEKFDQAATVYNQFDNIQAQLSRANALAHARRYIKARDIYQQLLSKDSTNPAATHNVKIVQAIIDETNRLSESQRAEEGESSKELGDEPQTSDGGQKKEGLKQEVEQLDASQLLLDPALNDMWLRQVQKDPALFLANKFQIQNERDDRLQDPLEEQSNE